MKKVFELKAVKIIASVVAALLFLCVGIGIGSNNATANINGEKVTYGNLIDKVDKAKTKMKDENDQLAEAQTTIAQGEKAKQDLSDVQSQLKNKQAELDKELADGKKTIDAQLADENQKLSDAKSQLADVQGQVSTKQKQLSSLNGQILQASGAPKTLIAGQYQVGKDIPAGRYVAHALDRGSNFFVYDSSGSPTVNTILGTAGGIGSGDYTFFTQDGDMIETHESVRLTPVQ